MSVLVKVGEERIRPVFQHEMCLRPARIRGTKNPTSRNSEDLSQHRTFGSSPRRLVVQQPREQICRQFVLLHRAFSPQGRESIYIYIFTHTYIHTYIHIIYMFPQSLSPCSLRPKFKRRRLSQIPTPRVNPWPTPGIPFCDRRHGVGPPRCWRHPRAEWGRLMAAP